MKSSQVEDRGFVLRCEQSPLGNLAVTKKVDEELGVKVMGNQKGGILAGDEFVRSPSHPVSLTEHCWRAGDGIREGFSEELTFQLNLSERKRPKDAMEFLFKVLSVNSFGLTEEKPILHDRQTTPTFCRSGSGGGGPLHPTVVAFQKALSMLMPQNRLWVLKINILIIVRL